MDVRVEDGLQRFLRGEFELFGNPHNSALDKVKIANEKSYQFSTFCVYLAVNSFNFPIEAFGDAVTEGYQERGFDGIVVTVDDQPIDSVEQAAEVAEAAIHAHHTALAEGAKTSPPVVKVLFVQVKMQARADMADLDYFGNSAVRFLTLPNFLDDLDPNQMVTRWWLIYDRIRQIHRETETDFVPEVDLLYIYRGFANEEKALNQHACKTCLSNLELWMGHEKVNFTTWRSDEIIDAIALADQSVDGVLKAAMLLPMPEVVNGYIGYVPAESVASIIPQVQILGETKMRPDDRVFAENVRSFTGDRNNLGAAGLRRTLTEGDGDELILRHNGITIVARKSELSGPLGGNPVDVKLDAFQIVNGAQSSFVLQRNVQHLGGAFIPVKIVVTENDQVKAGVVLGANTQTQVSAYDMLARCVAVRAMQQGFHAFDSSQAEMLWFRRRRGERFVSRVRHRHQIITPRQLLESFVSAYEGLPHRAHSSASSLIRRVPDDVFSRDHHPSVYRALGWLLVTGRRWADTQGLQWADQDDGDTIVADMAGREPSTSKYAARHQFVYALWHLVDEHPEDLHAEQGKLSKKHDSVRDRFEAVCTKLSDPDRALHYAQKAASAVGFSHIEGSPLSSQVRLKKFTERVKEHVNHV